MKIKIKKINIPNGRRCIAVSDVHGHCKHLESLLKKVNFSEKDILFIIGDIIEKGPESLKTLRYIMNLCKKYTVYPLIGNVDAWQLIIIENDSTQNYEDILSHIIYMKEHWNGCFFTDMCNELNIRIKYLSDIPEAKQKIRENFHVELEFLRSLPTIIETQNFIFVHGGLTTADIDSLVGADAFPVLKNNAFIEKKLYFPKYVIVGHWPVTLYGEKIACSNPIINRSQKIISIDGGCGLKRDGQLNAFIIPDINSTDFSFESYDDLPVNIAITPQEASLNSVNIRYTDNKIKILEKGDELSIIKKTSRGYLVKKNGISGWYRGKLKNE